MELQPDTQDDSQRLMLGLGAMMAVIIVWTLFFRAPPPVPVENGDGKPAPAEAVDPKAAPPAKGAPKTAELAPAAPKEGDAPAPLEPVVEPGTPSEPEPELESITLTSERLSVT
ncbi:hypothetical protein HQ560_02675, partial [bacterium]|nr:hypothetical protein [bacterium]